MDLLNSILDFVVPPTSMVMMAFAWPTLSFLHAVEWLFRSLYKENMENKVVVITGASSAIGEQLAYEYARKKANLVLVARREQRLRGIRENARLLGAKQVLVIPADVVKEEDCRRFISDTISYFGQLNHLVNSASLGHTFFFEEAIDTSVFPHMMAAKAAVINFYETLRFEVKDAVGITIATHGSVGGETRWGKLMLEEGAEMQWKEEREVPLMGGQIEEFAKKMVSGACRGEAYVKHPCWYDIFLLYRVLVPDVLGWTFRLLFSTRGTRVLSLMGTGPPLLDAPPPRKLLPVPEPMTE
uniref:11-beta-hydroxysteroid dehydrogenase-like 5 isoform X2 n=1 Tax=Elaeis guineensis var. tenera TaxID=51953 RepID=A0A8N4EZH2_ELAGV|nr:11-beta-hydroxysteroid dehydrogenase-like 5 isoform X2 [Elaeis guineensis]